MNASDEEFRARLTDKLKGMTRRGTLEELKEIIVNNSPVYVAFEFDEKKSLNIPAGTVRITFELSRLPYVFVPELPISDFIKPWWRL